MSTITTMTADERLALIWHKIDRADKHIQDLKSAVSAFHKAASYEISTKRNPDTRQLIYYVNTVPAINADVSTITGDAISNLRCALDHLAQQLYLVSSGSTVYRDQTSFLIAMSAKKFKDGLGSKVEGMRKDAVDAIRAIEPYDGGKGQDFWTLHRLNNIDKHRLIIALGSRYHVDLGPVMSRDWQRQFAGDPKFGSITLPSFFVTGDDPVPLKDGDELFIDAPDAEPNDKINFRFDIAIYEPGVAQSKSLLVTVQELAKLVSNTVIDFKPYLA